MKKIKKLFIILTTICLLNFCLLSTNIIYANAQEKTVYLGGFPVGFDLSGKGALVIGLTDIIGRDEVYSPCKNAGIKSGDYILSLDGKKVVCANDIDKILVNLKTDCVIAEILSDGIKVIKNIYPKKDVDGKLRLGVLIKDYLSGLGTVTYILEENDFYSLGHPVVDENGNLLNISGGYIYKCIITGVTKGERGKVGELQGAIIRKNIYGSVVKNTNVGILGKFDKSDYYQSRPKIKTGEAVIGKAKMYATVQGDEVKEYNVSIVKVDNNDANNKNLVIKINDKNLLNYTGGILQGMSGSPIVQNGRIVGAVTHVFINDPTRGFGISIDKMLFSS